MRRKSSVVWWLIVGLTSWLLAFALVGPGRVLADTQCTQASEIKFTIGET
ncbi:MAG: hypothetical protein M1299_07430 [Firmicutes bacterium]|nr:hypothetical protein [Bacillota bacterium]